MKDFTRAEKVAVKYLLEWGRSGEIDFPDSVVLSYFDLLSGNAEEKKGAVENLYSHVKGLLGEEKSQQVKKELLACIN